RLLRYLEVRLGIGPSDAWHQRWHVCGGGQVEEDGHPSHEGGHQEKLQEAKVTECEEQRDRREQGSAEKVGGNHDLAPAKSIDPDAREKPQRRPGERAGRVEEPDLCRRGLKDQDGYRWQ